MKRRRLWSFAALALLSPSVAVAAPARHVAAQPRGVADPRAFVAEMFAAYQRGDGDHPPPDPAYAYSPRLTALFAAYNRWQRAHPDIVGALDFDWWVDAQDWRISHVLVTVSETGAGRRTVAVRFRNADREDFTRFLFVAAGGRWYLDDAINAPGPGLNGWTLSALLRERE